MDHISVKSIKIVATDCSGIVCCCFSTDGTEKIKKVSLTVYNMIRSKNNIFSVSHSLVLTAAVF